MSIARAVLITQPGEPQVLTLGEHEVPAPGPGEILVEVAAAGLNRADVLQRRGLYPAPPGFPERVPGLEFAGIVRERGPGAERHAVGDRVMGIVGGGSMSTLLVTHEREALPVPAHLSLTEAAAIPEAFLTAHDAMFTQGLLAPGETALIHAAASGVGTAAIQLAHMIGARPVGTTRSPAKAARLRAEFDAEVLPPGNPAAWAAAMTGRSVDVILDPLGASVFAETLALTAPGARWVFIGLMGGAQTELPLRALLAKRLVLRGTTLRARPRAQKIAIAEAFARDAGMALGAGRLRPIIDAVLPMRDIAEAHARMERDETFGKLVLAW